MLDLFQRNDSAIFGRFSVHTVPGWIPSWHCAKYKSGLASEKRADLKHTSYLWRPNHWMVNYFFKVTHHTQLVKIIMAKGYIEDLSFHLYKTSLHALIGTINTIYSKEHSHV